MTTEKHATDWPWYSGDWQTPPRSWEPYNGIEISGVPTYDNENKFISAKITIFDFTKNKKGISSTIESVTLADNWAHIPEPVTSSPKDEFTVNGRMKLRLASSVILVRVHLDYGLEEMKCYELGMIGGFHSTKPVDV